MGGGLKVTGQSTEEKVVKTSPLGCVLKYWKELGGDPLMRKKLLEYCNHWWPMYKLEDQEKWPLNGTVNYNTILQLMLFCRREGKWDKVPYVDLFFTLRNHPEWQKDCMLTPKDPMVLALEKEDKRAPRRCCSACSIGKRCIKYRQDEEEDIEMLVGPGVGDRQELRRMNGNNEQTRCMGQRLAGHDLEEDSSSDEEGQYGGNEGFSTIAVGANGPVSVKVPFSVTNLRSWKELAGVYREDPDKVAKVLETVVRTQDPVWNDLQVIMDMSLSIDERTIVLAKAKEEAERIHAQGGQQGTVNNHFPPMVPRWDPNNPAQQELLARYQRLIVFGMKHAIPKVKNLSKLYQVIQRKEESPSVFFDRLMNMARRYTDLDPEKEGDSIQLVYIFIGQSAPDIKSKLQQLEGDDSRSVSKLLETAWKVYNNREEVEKIKERKEKDRDRKLLAALIKPGNPRKGPPRGRPKRGGAGGPRPCLERDQCAICKQKGHWKRKCSQNQPNHRGFGELSRPVANLMTLDED
uniref:Core shell protein Gag P30 domain-containing protein n=1 Tax=Apteryx owenii TaxID=8824 RepID=A0A8B9SD64_APTOW